MNWREALLRTGGALVLAAVVVVALTHPAVRERLRAFASRFVALPRARALLVIVVLTVGVRGALLPTFEPRHHADVKEYVDKAALIADEGTPREQEVRDAGWHFYRTLGWALPLAGWFKATGTRSVFSARVFCIVLAGGIAVLIALLGAAAVDEGTGRLAALGYGVFLPHVQFALVPYSETWATLVTVAAALLFERLRRDDGAPSGRRLGAALGLGVAVGALVITRAEFLWLPFLIVGLLLVQHRARTRDWLVAGCVVLAGCAAPIAVNHTMRAGYPGWMRTSSQSGLIFYFGNNPIAVPGHGNATPEVSRRVREMYREDPTGDLARQRAFAWMRANPGAVAVNAVKKAYFLWLAPPQGFGWLAQVGEPGGLNRQLAAVLRWTAHVQALALLLLGVVGLTRGFRPAYRLWAILLLLHLGMWCLLAASPRNKYPLEPFLLVAASAWLLGPANPGTRATTSTSRLRTVRDGFPETASLDENRG